MLNSTEANQLTAQPTTQVKNKLTTFAEILLYMLEDIAATPTGEVRKDITDRYADFQKIIYAINILPLSDERLPYADFLQLLANSQTAFAPSYLQILGNAVGISTHRYYSYIGKIHYELEPLIKLDTSLPDKPSQAKELISRYQAEVRKLSQEISQQCMDDKNGGYNKYVAWHLLKISHFQNEHGQNFNTKLLKEIISDLKLVFSEFKPKRKSRSDREFTSEQSQLDKLQNLIKHITNDVLSKKNERDKILAELNKYCNNFLGDITETVEAYAELGVSKEKLYFKAELLRRCVELFQDIINKNNLLNEDLRPSLLPNPVTPQFAASSAASSATSSNANQDLKGTSKEAKLNRNENNNWKPPANSRYKPRRR